MQRFRFELNSVLSWRRTQLDVEEAKLQKIFAERAAIERSGEALEKSMTASLDAVKSADTGPAERAAVDEYLRWIRFERLRLRNMLADCEGRISRQRVIVLEARRQCELLENLKARRHAEWDAGFQKELEQLAADAHLAKLARD